MNQNYLKGKMNIPYNRNNLGSSLRKEVMWYVNKIIIRQSV